MRAESVINTMLAFALSMVVLSLGAWLDLPPLNPHAEQLAREERARMAETAARKVMVEQRAKARREALEGTRHAEAR